MEIEHGARGYPPLLNELYDPPAVLHVSGAAQASLARPMVAVVGARSCSRYAELVATDVGRALAGAGLVVVSGLARGIDSAAHRGALESGGPTIAVLGCGVDVVYPKRNRDLFDDIRRCGLLISEYADATPAAPFRFPARNRIIAALSIATVVIEGRKGSGALITADFALETGRDVFAVPGEITSTRAAGTNGLIRQGATPVTSIHELLVDLGVAPEPSDLAARAERQLSTDDAEVLEAIAGGAQTLDELGRELGFDQATLATSITTLELAGVVQEDDGVYRARAL